MSQNGHSRCPGAGGTIGLGHSVVTPPPGSSMNLSSSPSSVVTWGHANNGASVSGAADNQNTSTQHQLQDDKTAGTPSSPQNSNHSGTTLKEHDLLGLSDVSSSTSRESHVQDNLQDEGNDFEELNLKMELGPPAARKKAVETNTAAFPHPRTPAAPTEQQQQVSSVSESGNSHGGCLEGSQPAEQSKMVAVDKGSSNAELQNGTSSEQQVSSDRGLTSRADTGAGSRTVVDSEALMKWHSEQGGGGGDRKSSNEGLRLGISLNSQRGAMQDALNEKNSFLNSVDRNRDSAQELKQQQQQQQQEDPSWQQERIFQEDVSNAEKTQERLMVQDQQQQQVNKQQQQQQLERQKQYEAYQMSEKRPIAERRCPPPALQPPSMEQRFQNVPERSPRLADPGNNNNRLWSNPMKFPTMVASCVPYHQQHPAAQQDIEASRAGFPVCAGNFAVNRNMYAAPKLGVTGSKRNFDAITCPDARNVNDARSGGLCGPSPVSGSSMNNTGSGPSSTEAEAKAALCQQQMKAQPGMQMYSWTQKPTLAAPSWHMGGLEQSGGSFGPFPSPQRPTPGASMAKNAAEVAAAAVAVDAKTWDGQLKGSHQEVVSTSSQKMSAPAETKQPSSEANTSLNVEASTVAPPRTSPAPVAVGWPPLRSFTRRNLAVVPPRPIPSETPPPRQPSTPASASTPSVAGQSNSWFVKVNMDGYPVGRKVDLRINSSYDKLSQALDEMFRPQFETFLNGQKNPNRMSLPCDLKRNFLQGPDFVLTYEDQEGDLMLVGDVPWTMFIDTVKRLRIMKGSEAIGLGNRAAEKSIKTSQPNA